MTTSALVTQKQDVDLLAVEFIASVVGVKDLPPTVQKPASRFLAGIFNDYGLDARLNEVGIFPVTKKVGQEWLVVDFGIWYGQSGYERMAHNDEKKWYFGNPRRLPIEEIEERYINICTGKCKGKGTYEEWSNQLHKKVPTTCDKCGGTGRFNSSDMIVYEVPFYDLEAAKLAKEAGTPYNPDLALGIFVIGVDTVWQTGTPEAKAQKRARKALLKRNFPLQYKMDNMVKTIEIRDTEDDPAIGPLPEDVTEGSFEEQKSPPLDSKDWWVKELEKYGYTRPEWRDMLTEMLFEGKLTDWVENDRHNLVEFGKRRHFLKKYTDIPINIRVQYALDDLDAMAFDFPDTLEKAYDELQLYARQFVARGEKMPSLDIEKTVKEWEASNV